MLTQLIQPDRGLFMPFILDQYATFCDENSICNTHESFVHCMPATTIELNRYLLNSKFVPRPMAEHLEMTRRRATRMLFVLTRFATRWKRKNQVAVNENDLSMTPIVTAANPFVVMSRGQKYVFPAREMMQIIHAALTTAIEFICEPQRPKNPYTGMELSDETLYSFYVFLRTRILPVPVLFSHFLSVHFRIVAFGIRFECLLRDVVIEAVVKNYTNEARRSEVKFMLDSIQISKGDGTYQRIVTLPATASNAEVNVFSPVLHQYHIYTYSMNAHYRHIAYRSVIRSLHEIALKN